MGRGTRTGALSCLVALTCWPLAAETVRVETTGPGPAQPGAETPAWPVRAVLSDPTGRYPHHVLGDIPAFTRLEVWAQSCGSCRHGSEVMRVTLHPPLVFEDTAPRLWDVTGDGRPEIVVVESHERLGARLAVWSYSDASGQLERRAATAHIGTRFRWLAPSGIGDLAGDGTPVIAYVDRPHLARELVFVTLDGNRLREIARIGGVSNHRIGDRTIAGGVRLCNGRTEVIVASADWSRLLAARVVRGRAQLRDLGPLRHSADFTAALACRI
ncbi:MAG: VCBS repeat-containing protein [Pseudorhodobacter sp.]